MSKNRDEFGKLQLTISNFLVGFISTSKVHQNSLLTQKYVFFCWSQIIGVTDTRSKTWTTCVHHIGPMMIKRAVLPTTPFARRFFFNEKNAISLGNHRSTSSLLTPTILEVLRKVEQGTLSAKDAEKLISSSTEGSKATDVLKDENQKVLESFANLDHSRTKRTGFPEAVFAEGKSPFQVASILNSMALRSSTYNGILATRVDPQLHKDVLEVYKTNSSLSDQLQKISGHIKYHEEARIISVHTNNSSKDGEKLSNEDNNTENFKVAVVCAGTTDIYVAEEAAVTLEQCSIPKEQNKNIDIQVERIYDVGVAGLHRIIRALPRLTSPDVKCVIVCAGMVRDHAVSLVFLLNLHVFLKIF